MACSALKLICMRLFTSVLLCLLSTCTSTGSSSRIVNIGSVDDFDSRSGKEGRVAMLIAFDDFYGHGSPQPPLQFKNSGGSPSYALSLAKSLIEENNVNVLMGFRTWEATAVTIDFSNKSRVPMLSLASEISTWASKEWPFLVSVSRSHDAQMKAVIAIVQSWQWRRVTIIYEDTASASDGIIPHLINGIQDAGVVIEQLARLSPWLAFSDKNYIHQELNKLKVKQCRVFIVHTSAKLGSGIFMQAKKLGMMGKESVWIATNAITNEMDDSLDATTISAMEGVLGVKSFFPTGNRFKSFRTKFRVQFKALYPKEAYREPGLCALQAYDALWALALATNSSAMSSESLVEKIFNSNFEGLSGEFKYSHGRLKAQKVFRIANFTGKSYREVGYWSDGLGFSVTLGKGSKFEKYMSALGPVIWPGGPSSVPRGYTIPTDANPLLVGVPTHSAFNDFVQVHCNDVSCTNPNVTGFSADVFLATLDRLPYNLCHKYVAYNGTYDNMIQEVQNQSFQAVIGDTSILAKRCQYAQFTPPYSESGLQPVIYVKNQNMNNAWLFKRPYSTQMWIFSGLINIYNGFVVWLIERRHNPDFRGSVWNQIGTLINLAFTTLFSLNGGNLHSNMSRITMLVWLFVALVITQSYTASLTSLLTADKLNPPKLDINQLQKNNDKVGCNGNSFVGSYLQTLGFREENILKVYNAEEYPQLLMNGTIKAAFLITPDVKIFLAKHCTGYATVEPTYKVGGFGFVFAKGHPLLPDISEAVLDLSESGELSVLESKMLSKYNCSESTSNDEDEHGSLGIDSFTGLFIITFGTSTLALISFCVTHLHKNRQWMWNNSQGAIDHHVAVNNHEPHEDEANMFAPDMTVYQRHF